MDWDAIGAVGEALGAVGVVLSLLYLAVQIRRNNVLALAESHRYTNQLTAPSVLEIAQDGDLARIFRMGMVDRSALTADDVVRFDMFLGALVSALSASVTGQITLGVYGNEGISDHRDALRQFLATPSGSAWWNVYRHMYPPVFQRFVAREILQREPPDPQQLREQEGARRRPRLRDRSSRLSRAADAVRETEGSQP